RPGLVMLALEAPAAGVLLVGRVEGRVRARPGGRIQPWAPHALRFGPHHAIGTVAFELSAIAGIQEFVVGPTARAHHARGLGDVGAAHADALRVVAGARPALGTQARLSYAQKPSAAVLRPEGRAR